MFRIPFPWLLAFLGCYLIVPVRGADKPTLKDAFALEEALQEAIKQAEPSVVCILISRQLGQRERLEDPKTVPQAFGSGVIIGVDNAKRPLILTNFHVVQEATQIYVRLPGGKGSYVQAKAITGDGRCDLAVFPLDTPVPVRLIKLGDGDHVRKGQMVLSIANLFAAGFHDGSPSASWGIISNIRRRTPPSGPEQEQDRSQTPLHQFGTLLQTDARLNLGCSGGALIDLKGELIGLTTAQAALTGGETAGGFAIPMNARMRDIIQVLKKGREVDYGFLGVSFDRIPFSDDGVHIGHVIAGSPAAKAGLRDNCTILAINNQPVHNADELSLAISTMLAGSMAELRVHKYPQPIRVTLTKFHYTGPVLAANKPAPVLGIRVDYPTVATARDSRPFIPEGVAVVEIQPGSPADKAKKLDRALITHVNGVRVNTPDEFYREAHRKPGPLELTIANGTDKVTLE